MNRRLQNSIADVLEILLVVIKGTILGLFLAAVLAFAVTIAEGAEGDYCLGEWDEATEVYCRKVAVASTALAMDRKIGMGIEDAYAQVEDLKRDWGVSKRLLNATVKILWDEEHIDPKTLNALQFGAVMEGQCIDSFDDMIGWE